MYPFRIFVQLEFIPSTTRDNLCHHDVGNIGHIILAREFSNVVPYFVKDIKFPLIHVNPPLIYAWRIGCE